ncbi:MAG TPA: hypothetical protein DCS97_14785 [Planctomycetes bacterium]|nr:hypothetical protein [Planctomycetota bacterium]
MIIDGMSLHNVTELEPWEGARHGVMHRIPRAVADRLRPRARSISQGSAGSEIRFVTEAPTVHLYISILRGSCDVLVYRGDLRENHHILETGRTACLELNTPPGFAGLPDDALAGRRFAPQVWRVVFENCVPVLHRLDAHGYTVRPPLPAELPRRRWLAYGSSITHGSTATRQVNSYVQQAAWRLTADVCNLGMGGACGLEPEMVEEIAQRDDWQVCTCELGINVHDYGVEEFSRRAEHLVRTIRARRPDGRLALITHFLFRAHLLGPDHPGRATCDAYDTVLRNLAAAHGCTLIEGRQILTHAGGLTGDLVHPHDHGMQMMGENLARVLDPLFPT